MASDCEQIKQLRDEIMHKKAVTAGADLVAWYQKILPQISVHFTSGSLNQFTIDKDELPPTVSLWSAKKHLQQNGFRVHIYEDSDECDKGLNVSLG